MEAAQLKQLIGLGREQAGVEFKGPGSREDKAFATKVVRAVMAMANRRDGGIVVIGVEEPTSGILVPTGLNTEQLASWGFDTFSDLVASYAEPFVKFDLGTATLDGKEILVIEVSEFEEEPILCRRGYEKTLRNGALYVRSGRKPESLEVSNSADMRRVLDLATEKSLLRYRRLADADARAELLLGGAIQDSRAAFDREKESAFEDE